MKALMFENKRFFATTLLEAEALVSDLKKEHGSNIKQHSITKKVKKDIEFYIVSVSIEYYKVNDLVITE
jgi:hypothetical protein